MGIEPTDHLLDRRPNDFEDRAEHQLWKHFPLRKTIAAFRRDHSGEVTERMYRDGGGYSAGSRSHRNRTTTDCPPANLIQSWLREHNCAFKTTSYSIKPIPCRFHGECDYGSPPVGLQSRPSLRDVAVQCPLVH